MDGYRKLTEFRDAYGALDDGILPYLNLWLMDYVVYYNLDAGILADDPQVRFNRGIAALDSIQSRGDEEVIQFLLLLGVFMQATGQVPQFWFLPCIAVSILIMYLYIDVYKRQGVCSRGGQRVSCVGVGQVAGGICLAGQPVGDTLKAALAGVADPQTGVHVVLVHPA